MPSITHAFSVLLSAAAHHNPCVSCFVVLIPLIGRELSYLALALSSQCYVNLRIGNLIDARGDIPWADRPLHRKCPLPTSCALLR